MCAGRNKDKEGVNWHLACGLGKKEGALFHVCWAREGQRRGCLAP